jgi:hypothetical protein
MGSRTRRKKVRHGTSTSFSLRTTKTWIKSWSDSPPPLFEFLVIYNIINDGGSIFQSRNMSPFNLSFQSPLLPVEISADAFFTSSFTYPEGESVQVNTNYKACIFSLPHLTCTHLEFKLLIINELLSAQCFTICYFNSKLLPHFCQPVIPVEMSDDPQSSLEEKWIHIMDEFPFILRVLDDRLLSRSDIIWS